MLRNGSADRRRAVRHTGNAVPTRRRRLPTPPHFIVNTAAVNHHRRTRNTPPRRTSFRPRLAGKFVKNYFLSRLPVIAILRRRRPVRLSLTHCHSFHFAAHFVFRNGFQMFQYELRLDWRSAHSSCPDAFVIV